MNQFQSLFENVCRCFGHTPTSRGTAGEPFENMSSPDHGDSYTNEQHRQSLSTVNSEASSIAGKRRTNKLKLNDKQYDELFDKVQRGSSRTSKGGKNSSRSSTGQPPRPDGQKNKNGNGGGTRSISDNDTAQALAQAKLAANPPRYRTKRKRPVQTREEIFRSKNGNRILGSTSCMNGGGGGKAASAAGASSTASSIPKPDFSRLLNPSLALCFATPIRGTEEEQEELDLKSLDHSDTATLNTNGDDTITSTLYFDSKYAHIQESTPPMPLFSQFKIGQAKDEIRTIMATDSHSSVRMIKIMEQNQQQEQVVVRERTSTATTVFEEARRESSSDNGMVQHQQQQQQEKSSRSRNHRVVTQTPASSTKGSSSRRMKETIKITSDGRDREDEMEDAVPDVKPLSSSTDSSRLSNNAARHTSIQ